LLYHRNVFFNATVQKNVITSNGVSVTLSDAAVAQIQSQYDGTPLRVQITYRPPCCGSCKLACGGCLDCSCIPIVAEPVYAHSVWFGQKDKEASCPGIVSTCCFSWLVCLSPCFEKTVSIGPQDIALSVLASQQIAVSPAHETMPH